MEWLSDLWLPILVSSVGVFFASFLLWMVLPFHKGDYKALPNEAALQSALRAASTPPGQYMFPYCDMKATPKEEMERKWKEGPVGVVLVRPAGAYSMGSSLLKWFIYIVVVVCLVAYAAWHGLTGKAPDGMEVFRMVGVIAMLAFAAANVPSGIWKGVPAPVVVRDVIDGVIYGVITAISFALLWPSPEVALPGIG